MKNFKRQLNEALKGIEHEPGYNAGIDARVIALKKTHTTVDNKLQSVGINVQFKFVKDHTKAAALEQTAATPGVLTVIRWADSGLDHMTAWMMLHQIGHAMQKAKLKSYDDINNAIMRWWKDYAPYLSSRADYNFNESFDDYDEPPDLGPRSEYVEQDETPKPIPRPKGLNKLPNPTIGTKELKDTVGKVSDAGVRWDPTIGEAFICKFLAFKSARDTWETTKHYLQRGELFRTSTGRVAASRSGAGYMRGVASDRGEIVNDLVAEYIWHGGRIRYVDDPNDAYVVDHPGVVQGVLKLIEGYIKTGLSELVGMAISV